MIATRPQHKTLLDRLNLSPENRLLVLCARLDLTPDQRDQVETLLQGAPLDWDQVVHKVRWHLFPLVFRHLQGMENKGKVPAEIMVWLKAAYVTNAARSIYFRQELNKVLEKLRAEGVSVIVLKGAVLAEQVYQSSSLRPMTDLDLLVQHDDAAKADSIVRDLGYVPSAETEVQEAMRVQDRQLARLAGVGKPVIFDIHSHIVEADNPLRFDISGFWERAVATEVADAPAKVLCPEDLLTHLALNFFKDLRFNSFSALGELCDMSEAIRRNSARIDWDRFVQDVVDSNLTGPVFCALYLAQHISGAPIPDRVLDQLEPPGFDPKDVDRLVRQRILGEYWVAKALVDPAAPYSWRSVLRGMLRKVVPAKRVLADHYDVPVNSRRMVYLYFRRIGDALQIAAKLVTKPGDTRDDLAVDRWLHSLYGAQHKGNLI